MEITDLIDKGLNFLRQHSNIGANSSVLFMQKTEDGYDQKGEVTGGFFLEKTVIDKETFYLLRLPMTDENIALYNTSTDVVILNYNAIFNGFYFNIRKEPDFQPSMVYFKIPVKATKQKYTPPPTP